MARRTSVSNVDTPNMLIPDYAYPWLMEMPGTGGRHGDERTSAYGRWPCRCSRLVSGGGLLDPKSRQAPEFESGISRPGAASTAGRAPERTASPPQPNRPEPAPTRER